MDVNENTAASWQKGIGPCKELQSSDAAVAQNTSPIHAPRSGATDVSQLRSLCEGNISETPVSSPLCGFITGDYAV